MGFDSASDNYLKSSDHRTGSDLEYFTDIFGSMRFERSLDVASAAGHFANAFNADIKITTDLSLNMLKKGREAFGLDAPVLAQAQYLPFLSDTFDLVGCRIAMHHFRCPCMFFGEVARILKKGGYFILIDSIVDDGDEHLNAIELMRDPTHIKSHTVEDIKGMAEAEGLTTYEAAIFPKRHDFREWVTRLNPSEEVCSQVENMFQNLPEDYAERYRLEIKEGRLISYTDKKALFIFKK